MDNLAFQKELLSLAEQGYTIIVESRKLANQLQWRYRLRLPESGRAGWEQPTIVTLNDWADSFWENLWPETWPASSFSRWRLLLQAMEDLPPPQPLCPDIVLVLQVDETLGHCLRYGMDPGRGEAANQLIEWRRSLWEPYSNFLGHRGLFHPASLSEKLFGAFKDSPNLIPQKLALWVESLRPSQTMLLAIIAGICLITGTVIDVAPSIILLGSVFAPIAFKLQIDPVHFGVLLVYGMAIGLFTPPVGTTLILSCYIAKTTLFQSFKACLPFLIGMILVLAGLVFFKEFALFLPNLLFH